MKKILSIILSITMLLCMIPMATGIAFASNELTLTATESAFSFNALPQAPTYIVKYGETTINGATFTYTGEGLNNSTTVPIEPGTYTVTASYASGTDTLTGTNTFTINKIGLDTNGVAINVGKQLVPSTPGELDYTVLVNGKEVNTNDFVIGINSSENPATATFTATEANKYFAYNTSCSSTFTIAETLTVSFKNASDASLAYSGAEQTPEIVVKAGETTLTKNTDYVVGYNNNKNVGTATITVTGVNNYTGSNATTTFSITKKDIKDCDIIVRDCAYNAGNAVTPEVIITNGTEKLLAGTDFKVETTNTAIGDATVTIEALSGNYSGLIVKPFKIVNGKPLSAAAISIKEHDAVNKCTYDGKTKTVQVKYNGTLLSEGTDYTKTLTIKKPGDTSKVNTTSISAAGEYEIIITAKNGNAAGYTGDGKYTFTINPIDFSKDTLTATAVTTTFSSSAKPTITLKANNLSLTATTDYTVETTYRTSASTSASVATSFPAYVQVKAATSNKNFTGTGWVKVTNEATGDFATDGYYFYTAGNTSSARNYSYAQYKSGTKYQIPEIRNSSNVKITSNVTFEYWTGSGFSSNYSYVSGGYLLKDGLYRVTFTDGRTYTTWYATGGQYPLSNYTLKLSSSSTTYSYRAGNTVTAPTVSSLQIGSYTITKLTKDYDYTVSIKAPNGYTTTSSSWKDQGVYTFTATPKNTYASAFSGSATATFTLGAVTALTESSVTVTGYTTEYKLSGTETKKYISNPASGMKIYKGTAISSNLITDYTTSIVDGNTSSAKAVSGYYYTPGTYYIKITFTGAYSGTIYKPFKVVGNPNTIICYDDTITVRALTDDEVRIDASCLKGNLTYTSSNPSVAEVIYGGYVYLSGKVGTAKITITSPTQDGYTGETKYVYINAKPSKAVFKSVTSPKKGAAKFQVKKQDGVERYQIRYSYKSKDVSEKYGQTYINDNPKYKSTQSKTITKSSYIKTKKPLYVKYRCVYTKADGTKGYGSWSNVKKITIK